MRYAIHFFDKLGLSGSDFGDIALPVAARERKHVDHWINWPQCYQPPGFPDNAISCALAYHPFPQPRPRVRAVFEAREDRVVGMTFDIDSPKSLKAIISERRSLAKSR